MKICEIMTRDVKTLSGDLSVKEAMKELFSRGMSGLPVVSSEGKPVGMFTEKDVLQAILPSYVSQVGRFVYENGPKTITSKAAKLSKLRVEDLMHKDVIKVSEETPVSEVAHIMLTQNIRRAPVVDREGRMTGIVSRADVLKCLLKG